MSIINARTGECSWPDPVEYEITLYQDKSGNLEKKELELALVNSALGGLGKPVGKPALFDASEYCVALEEGVPCPNQRGRLTLDRTPGKPTIAFDITSTWLGEGVPGSAATSAANSVQTSQRGSPERRSLSEYGVAAGTAGLSAMSEESDFDDLLEDMDSPGDESIADVKARLGLTGAIGAGIGSGARNHPGSAPRAGIGSSGGVGRSGGIGSSARPQTAHPQHGSEAEAVADKWQRKLYGSDYGGEERAAADGNDSSDGYEGVGIDAAPASADQPSSSLWTPHPPAAQPTAPSSRSRGTSHRKQKGNPDAAQALAGGMSDSDDDSAASYSPRDPAHAGGTGADDARAHASDGASAASSEGSAIEHSLGSADEPAPESVYEMMGNTLFAGKDMGSDSGVAKRTGGDAADGSASKASDSADTVVSSVASVAQQSHHSQHPHHAKTGSGGAGLSKLPSLPKNRAELRSEYQRRFQQKRATFSSADFCAEMAGATAVAGADTLPNDVALAASLSAERQASDAVTPGPSYQEAEEMRDEIKTLKEQLVQSAKAADKHTQRAGAAEAEVEEVKAQLAEAWEQLREGGGTDAGAAAEVFELQAANEEVTAIADELATKNESLAAENDILRARVSALEERGAAEGDRAGDSPTRSEPHAHLRQEIEALATQNEDLSTDNDILKDRLALADGQSAELGERVGELESFLSAAEAKAETLQVEADEAIAALASAREALGATKEELEKARAQAQEASESAVRAADAMEAASEEAAANALRSSQQEAELAELRKERDVEEQRAALVVVTSTEASDSQLVQLNAASERLRERDAEVESLKNKIADMAVDLEKAESAWEASDVSLGAARQAAEEAMAARHSAERQLAATAATSALAAARAANGATDGLHKDRELRAAMEMLEAEAARADRAEKQLEEARMRGALPLAGDRAVARSDGTLDGREHSHDGVVHAVCIDDDGEAERSEEALPRAQQLADLVEEGAAVLASRVVSLERSESSLRRRMAEAARAAAAAAASAAPGEDELEAAAAQVEAMAAMEVELTELRARVAEFEARGSPVANGDAGHHADAPEPLSEEPVAAASPMLRAITHANGRTPTKMPAHTAARELDELRSENASLVSRLDEAVEAARLAEEAAHSMSAPTMHAQEIAERKAIELEVECDTLRTRRDALEAELSAAQSRLASATSERDEAHAKLREARTAAEAMRIERDGVTSELEDVKDALASSKARAAEEQGGFSQQAASAAAEAEELRARVAQLEGRDADASRVEAQLLELSAEHNALKAEFESAAEASVAEADTLTAERDASHAERDKLAAKLAEVERASAAASSNSREETAEARAAAKLAEERAAEREGTVAELETRVGELNDELAGVTSRLEEVLEAQRTSDSAATDARDALQASVVEISEERDGLRARLTELEGLLAAEEARSAQRSADAEAAEGETADLLESERERADALQARLAEAEASVAAAAEERVGLKAMLEAERDHAESRAAKLEADLRDAEATLSSERDGWRKKRAAADEASAKLEALTMSEQILRTECDDLRGKLDAAEADVQSARERAEAAAANDSIAAEERKSAAAAAERATADARDEAAALRAALARAERAESAAREDGERLQTERNELASESDRLRAEVDALRTQTDADADAAGTLRCVFERARRRACVAGAHRRVSARARRVDSFCAHPLALNSRELAALRREKEETAAALKAEIAAATAAAEAAKEEAASAERAAELARAETVAVEKEAKAAVEAAALANRCVRVSPCCAMGSMGPCGVSCELTVVPTDASSLPPPPPIPLVGARSLWCQRRDCVAVTSTWRSKSSPSAVTSPLQSDARRSWRRNWRGRATRSTAKAGARLRRTSSRWRRRCASCARPTPTSPPSSHRRRASRPVAPAMRRACKRRKPRAKTPRPPRPRPGRRPRRRRPPFASCRWSS